MNWYVMISVGVPIMAWAFLHSLLKYLVIIAIVTNIIVWSVNVAPMRLVMAGQLILQ